VHLVQSPEPLDLVRARERDLVVRRRHCRPPTATGPPTHGTRSHCS
jgi:hypothetical protein